MSLHYSPIQFYFAFFKHLLMVLFASLYFSDPSSSNRFFLSSLLLSHRSRSSAVTQGFCLLTMFAKGLTGCFSHWCVEGGDHWVHVCIFIVHDGERCNHPAYHCLEGFQHIRIFHFFEVRREFCVFWLANSFQAKVGGHHQQVVVLSNVCFWKTSCFGTVHS